MWNAEKKGMGFRFQVSEGRGQMKEVRGNMNSKGGQKKVGEEGLYDVANHGIKMEAVTVNSGVTDFAGNFTGQDIVLGHDLWDHYFKTL